MDLKRATNPIIATIILLVIGILVAGTIWIWNTVGSSEEPIVYQLEVVSARLVKPVSVENARWQIELLIRNMGNVDDNVEKIYVNRVLVLETGLSSGDSLSSGSSTGTDIPKGGLVIPAGETAIAYVWVGSDLYSTGTTITVEVQRQNQYELKKYVTLN